jgi:hypothetical protein
MLFGKDSFSSSLKEEDIAVCSERCLVFFYQLRSPFVGKKKYGLCGRNSAVLFLSFGVFFIIEVVVRFAEKSAHYCF